MLQYRLDLKEGSYHHAITADAFSRSFPFCPVNVGYFHAGDIYHTKRDALDNYLLIITVDGKGEMHQDGQSCTLEKGSALLIDCNPYQEYHTAPGHDWKFFFLHFLGASMDGYRSLLLQKLSPVQLRSLSHACHLIEQIHQNDLLPSAKNTAEQSNLVSALLSELINSPDFQSETEGKVRTEITHLAEFIRTNCQKDLHLDDFVKLTHLSKHHLIRTFEKQMGLSPYKYLHQCRIEKAILLLGDNEKSIAQIAYEVGYNDPVVFIRHFKFFHKMPPGQYRGAYILLPNLNLGV